MGINNIKKTNLAIFLLSICLAIFFTETACSNDSVHSKATFTEYEGNWEGQIKTKSGTLTSINLKIDHIRSGQNCVTMDYGGNRSCTLTGNYQGMENDKLVFILSSSSGAFCIRLTAGTLEISRTDNDEISYGVKSSNDESDPVDEAGKLRRAAD